MSIVSSIKLEFQVWVLKNLGSNPDLAKAWNLQISRSELLSSYNLIYEYFTEKYN